MSTKRLQQTIDSEFQESYVAEIYGAERALSRGVL